MCDIGVSIFDVPTKIYTCRMIPPHLAIKRFKIIIMQLKNACDFMFTL